MIMSSIVFLPLFLQMYIKLLIKFCPEDSNYVRCLSYWNLFYIQETSDCFDFICMSQFDAKISIPSSLLNITLPNTLQNWFNNLVENANNYDSLLINLNTSVSENIN